MGTVIVGGGNYLETKEKKQKPKPAVTMVDRTVP